MRVKFFSAVIIRFFPPSQGGDDTVLGPHTGFQLFSRYFVAIICGRSSEDELCFFEKGSRELNTFSVLSWTKDTKMVNFPCAPIL